jgi:hypothetical protein
MREKMKVVLCSLCVVGVLASFAGAAPNPGSNPGQNITFTLVPKASVVAGGTFVTVEAFVSAGGAGDEGFRGVQFDFPCNVPGKVGSLGSIGSGAAEGVASPNAVVADDISGSNNGTPHFRGTPVGGFNAINQMFCRIAQSLPAGGAVTVPSGATRYAGEITYFVSECAAGQFNVDLQGTGGTTTFARDEANAPIGFNAIGTQMTVQTGTCCDGTTCLCDNVSAACCTNAAAVGRPPECGAASSFNAGQTCELAPGVPNPIACACTMDSQCDNGQFCDGLETCDETTGNCVPGMAPVCPGTDQCNLGECDPMNNGGDGGCEINPRPDGTACVNPDPEGPAPCDAADTCLAGACVENHASSGTDCGDPNPLDPECDNRDTCDGNGNCSNNNKTGTCTDDGNQCTNDTCAAGLCTHPNKADGTVCNDGFNCTDNDECNKAAPGTPSECAGTPRNCDDGDDCTSDSCVETPSACADGYDPATGCCNDDIANNPCSTDADCAAVVGAVCTGGDGIPGDPNPGLCACNPCIGRENGFACDDGDPCTNSACYNEECVSSAICPSDGDVCTDDCDGSVVCDNPTGENSAGTCSDDGSPCTVDKNCFCNYDPIEGCNDPNLDLVPRPGPKQNPNCYVAGEPCDHDQDCPGSECSNGYCADSGVVVIDVVLSGGFPIPIAGGQFRIDYDPTCLVYQDASASPNFVSCDSDMDCPPSGTCEIAPGQVTGVCAGDGYDPWGLLIFEQVDAVNGVVFIAVGVPVQGTGQLKGDNGGIMASLTFTKVGKCNECDLCFTDVNPQHTRLTTIKGDEVDPKKLECSKTILDNRPTTVNCPPDQEVNSDCDGVTATVTWPAVVGSDQCDGTIQPVYTCEHRPVLICSVGKEVCQPDEDGRDAQVGDDCFFVGNPPKPLGECVEKFPSIFEGDDGTLCNDFASNGGELPQGRYIFTADIKNSADNSCRDGGSCRWTVRVSDHQSLNVHVQLSPVIQNKEFQRCICFELYSSCSPEVVEESCHTMTFGGPFQFAGQSIEKVKVKKGKYVCITARDRQHSLRATHYPLTCDTVSQSYSAEFKGDPFFGGNWLIQGNLNRDPVIDILDFGVFIGQLNQNPDPKQDKLCEDNFGQGYTHADINGDGRVDVADFTFIQINFLEDDKNSCCPDSPASAPVQGVTEISVKDLRQMGLGDLAVADLNDDGLVNMTDMASYLEGARPKAAVKGERGTNGRGTGTLRR